MIFYRPSKEVKIMIQVKVNTKRKGSNIMKECLRLGVVTSPFNKGISTLTIKTLHNPCKRILSNRLALKGWVIAFKG